VADFGSWDVISDAHCSEVILCADFPAAGRPAGFAGIARRIGSGYAFLQTRPQAAHPDQRLSVDAYVRDWIDGITGKGLRVRAVLGYGIGGVYAAAIAEGLERWQSPPQVILFDPRSAGMAVLASECRKEINGISSLLSDDEIERIEAVVSQMCQPMCQPTATDLAVAAAEMAEAYTELGSVAYQRVGLGGACGSRFLASFESYLTWITQAAQIDPSFSWKRSAALVSSEYLGWADQPGCVGQVIPFDMGHGDLLRADCVADEVRRLLGCPS
jgi:hypothetical protein